MKKTSFLSRLGAKMALAAVALTSAVFVGCSEEDIAIDNPGTTPSTPELANPTCQITVSVIDAGTGAVVAPSLTASAGTVSGNTIVLTGESISAQTVTITQAKGENYAEDGVVSVAVPALSKGQAAYLSATIIMVPKSNVVAQGAKYQIQVIVLDQNGKEVTAGLDKITASAGDVKDGVVTLTDDNEIAAQDITITYPANDKYNKGEVVVKVPAVKGEGYAFAIIYVTEVEVEDPTVEPHTFNNGYVALLPTAAGIDKLPTLDEYTKTNSVPGPSYTAKEDEDYTIKYINIHGIRPEEPAARSVEEDLLAEAKGLSQFNTYKEEKATQVVSLKKGQTLTWKAITTTIFKSIEFEATKEGEESVKVQFHIAIYSTVLDINKEGVDEGDYKIVGSPKIVAGASTTTTSTDSKEAGELQINWSGIYYVQSGEKVLSSRATKSELISQQEAALYTYTEVAKSFTQLIPHYYVATATSTVTKTPYTYTYTISNGVEEDTFTISTVNYSSTFKITVEAGKGHSHNHCDGHNGHGHGDTEKAGGGIVNPVN